MTPPLFFANPVDLARADGATTIELSGQEAHHAVRSQRVRVGDAVWVGDGNGRVGIGNVSSTDPDRCVIAIDRTLDIAPVCPRITVIQAIPKNDQAERTVSALTEAGADAIVPWQSERSIGKWVKTKSELRWGMWARAAAKQSRRPLIPEIATPIFGRQALTDRVAHRAVVVLDAAASTSVLDVGLDAIEVTLIVGPEGGFSDAEQAVATESGAVVCSLGPNVLRTSTAGAVAVGALVMRRGDRAWWYRLNGDGKQVRD